MSSITLPTNLPLERACLGHLLQQPDGLERAEVSADLFAFPAHRTVYAILRQLRDADQPIDVVSVSTLALGSAVEGAMTLVATCVTEAEGSTLATVLPVLVTLARRRRLARLGDALVRLAADDGPEDIESLGTLSAQLEDLALKTPQRAEVVASHAALAEYVTQGDAPVDPPIPTGFACLDLLITGLYRGQLAILAARPSVGKSALAHQIVAHAVGYGARVLLATPEMHRMEIIERMLAQRTGVTTTTLRRRPLPAPVQQLILNHAPQFPAFDLCDDPEPAASDVRRLVARARAAGHPYDLVIVDHLGWMQLPGGRVDTLATKIGMLTKALKAIARRERCALLVVSQLNRGSEEAEQMRKPVLSELRNSGEIEQDADTVLLLHRATRASSEGTVIVAKQRNGPTGEELLWWDGPRTRWIEPSATAGEAA